MSIKFSHALLVGAVVYLGTEVLISLNRPLIADRWVSESIVLIEKGKKHEIDASMEMDVFTRGHLTDVQLERNDFGIRFQIDGKDKNVGRLMGYPALSYTPNTDGVRRLYDGLCEVEQFKRLPGNDGGLAVFTEKGCPNFEIHHMVGDRIYYVSYKEDREMRVIFERNSRLNPLARMLTVWNRQSYLDNAEKFIRHEPI